VGAITTLVADPGAHRPDEHSNTRILALDRLHNIIGSMSGQAVAAEQARVPGRGDRPVGGVPVAVERVETGADNVAVDIAQALITRQPSRVAQVLVQRQLVAGRRQALVAVEVDTHEHAQPLPGRQGNLSRQPVNGLALVLRGRGVG
jgi:hypothetical protein